MKSMLMYNYNLINPIIMKTDENVYVKDNKKLYIFYKLKNENIEIIEYTNKDKSFYKTIKNRNNNYMTAYKDNYYILIEISNSIDIKIDNIFQNNKEIKKEDNNWIERWKLKLDEIDKAINVIDNAYINETKDYYIGLGETALLFLLYNKEKITSKSKFLCHKRISKKYFQFPTNAILDNKERDISEYIKYLYFEKNKTGNYLLNILKRLDLNKYDKYLIYSRLMFPTYYFDIIDNYFDNKNTFIEEILRLLEKLDNYEKFLYQAFNVFFDDNEHKIEWLKKEAV